MATISVSLLLLLSGCSCILAGLIGWLFVEYLRKPKSREDN